MTRVISGASGAPGETSSTEQTRKRRKQAVEFILEECRMVMPGVQALFGFQLIATFNQRFVEVSEPAKMVHLIACFCTVAAIGFMMAPAAYHRQVKPDGIPESLSAMGSLFARMGIFALMVSTSLDMFVVSDLVTKNRAFSVIGAASCLTFLFSIWFALPAVRVAYDKKPDEKIENSIVQLGQKSETQADLSI